MDKLQQATRLALERSLATNAKRNERRHKMALNLSRQETFSVFGNGGSRVQLLGHARGLNRNYDAEDKENKAYGLRRVQEPNGTGKRPAYQPLDGFDTDDDPAATLGHPRDQTQSQNIAATSAVGTTSSSTTPGTRGVMTRSRAKRQRIMEDHDIQALHTLQTNSASPSTSSLMPSDSSIGQDFALSPSASTCSDDIKGQGSTTSVKEAEIAPPHAEGPSSCEGSSRSEPTSLKVYDVYDLTVPSPPHTEESQMGISSSSNAKTDEVSSSAEICTIVNLTDTATPKQSASSGISVVGGSKEVPGGRVERTVGAATDGEPNAKDLKPTTKQTTTPILDEKGLDHNVASSLATATATATATPLVSDIALKSSDILDDASDVASDVALSDTDVPLKYPMRLSNNSATSSIMPTVVDTDDETVDMDTSDSETSDMDISDSDLPTIHPTTVKTNSDVEVVDIQQTTDLDDSEESDADDSDDDNVDDVNDLFVVKAGPSKPWKGLKRLRIFTDQAHKDKRRARALLRKVNRLAANNAVKKNEAWAALGFAAPTPEQKKEPLGHVAFAKSDANRPSWDEWWVLPFSR